MQRAFRNLLALFLGALQFLTMTLSLVLCLGGIRGLIGGPTWKAAAVFSVCAASAVICGYGCLRIYKCRTLTLGSALISLYACVALWYFWAVELPGFHG
jgi:hypothetical protein